MDQSMVSDMYLPILFKLDSKQNELLFSSIKSLAGLVVLDLFIAQKKEFFKIKNPSKPLKPADLDNLYNQWAADKIIDNEGIWVHYPWLNKLIHIIDENEFIYTRTNRNHYKITPQEQEILLTKTLGVIGLSVGHAVALNIATERICGKIKLADFDTIELSNLNRIKTGIQNIGLNKAVVTAREIAEIDPFIAIECYTDGLTLDNIDTFMLDGGKLDILIDECDGLDMKILCRQHAKKHKIPVVMETSDRGMLDVERYDIEEDRPLLHGLVNNISTKNIKDLTNEEKIPIILKMIGSTDVSTRGKASMIEVAQTISTWPQLASAVSLGGAVVTDVCRRILLDSYKSSGRYYIDIEKLTGDRAESKGQFSENPFSPFNIEKAKAIINLLPKSNHQFKPDTATINQLVRAACQAPSTGNDQPWKWVYDNGALHLFHDKHRSFSFGDFDWNASYISFGAAFENLLLKTNQLGLSLKKQFQPLSDYSELIATIEFDKSSTNNKYEKVALPELADYIFSRTTNRNPSKPEEISLENYTLLRKAAESVDGAQINFITDREKLILIGKIIGECDRIRILNSEGHRDFVDREMRWSKIDAEKTRDGIDIETLGMSTAQLSALSIIKDENVISFLRDINGGNAFVDAALRTTSTASCIGFITLPTYSKQSFFAGGMAMQLLWLQAEALGLAVHPLISPFYLFSRIIHGNGAGLDAGEIEKLTELRKLFINIMPITDGNAEVFLFKLAKANQPIVKSYRLSIDQTLFLIND